MMRVFNIVLKNKYIYSLLKTNSWSSRMAIDKLGNNLNITNNY